MLESTPAELALLARAQAFAKDHVAPQIVAFQSEGRSSLAWFPIAAQSGLLSTQVPVALGGAGLSYACKMQLTQILARADFGVAMAMVNTQNVAERISRLGKPDTVQTAVPGLIAGKTVACTALTEPGAGSDFAAIQTTATPVEGGWALNGAKTWIINAHHADWFIVYAQTQPGAGANGVAAFLVDAHAPGFERQAGPPMGPISTMGTGGFTLTQYFCPPERMLAPAGEAFKDIMRSINGARTYVAAMCCGMVAECLSLAQAYGQSRQTFGKPLRGHQGWRWALADAEIDLQAAQLLVNEAAVCINQGRDAQKASAQAKIFSTRMAQRHIAALMHAMGAEGLRDNYPFVRHLAAAQVAAFVDGSTEMLLDRLGKDDKAASGN